jgi:hypothetical protein
VWKCEGSPVAGTARRDTHIKEAVAGQRAVSLRPHDRVQQRLRGLRAAGVHAGWRELAPDGYFYLTASVPTLSVLPMPRIRHNCAGVALHRWRCATLAWATSRPSAPAS